MKHIQKLRKLILTLGILAGMSLTAYAATAYTSGQIRISDMANGDIIKGTCTIFQNVNRALEIYDTDGTTQLQQYNYGKSRTLSALGYDTIVTKTGVASGGYDNRLVKLQKLSPSPTVTSVTLDKNELSLDAGGATAELIATVEANYDAIKGVTWSSSDSTVATVNSNGVITPVGAGDPVTIKATSPWDNTKYPECTVTVTVSVNKTALNDAIKAAETLYDSIKAVEDYSDIASTLYTAIDAAKDVADSETVDQDAVDAAKTAITTAKTNAEAAKKDVDDTTEANKVSTLIEDLPAKEAITKDDKTKVDAAKAAYDYLTEDQKKKVSDANKQKLNDAIAAIKKDEADTAAANAVITKINALPASDAITSANKDAIEAARAAYDALTDAPKAKISDTVKNKLKAAETAVVAAEFNEYKEAQKTAAENKAQDGDSDATNALITAAKAKIDALTYDATKTLDENKAAVTAVVTQLATAIAAQRAAEQPVTVAAKADPSTTGTYYATFYDSTKSYTADCEVYYATANADGRLTLQKAEGNVIKAGEGVILKATSENVTLTKTTTEASYDSLLTGSDTETTVENALVLSLGKNGVWFYKYSGTLGANKAYLAQ